MFKKLLEKIETANFKSAVSKGLLACPNCGKRPRMRPASADDAIVCESCATTASALEWSIQGTDRVLAANPDQAPPNTKITREVDFAGTVIWNIPASGKSGGLLLFGVLWCLIVAVVSAGFLFSDSESGDEPPMLVIIPFLGLFWAIGLGMLYAGCRNKFAKHRVSVSQESVSLRRELFGNSKDQSFPKDSIASVSQVQFYEKNYQPVNGVEIKGSRGKLRFGSILSDEEKAWLVADLKRVILGVSPTAPRSEASSSLRQSYFSFPLPQFSEKLWPFAIMFILSGVGLVCVGLFFIEPDTCTTIPPGFAKVFEMVFPFMRQDFSSIWILGGGLFAAIGISMAAWQLRTKDQQTSLEGTDAEIAIRTSRHGLVLKERLFPRASVIDIRASVSGSSNGKPMKRIELIVGGKAESLTHWTDGEMADAFVEEVRRAL